MGNRFVCDKCGANGEVNSKDRFEVNITAHKFCKENGHRVTFGKFDLDKTFQYCLNCGDELLADITAICEEKELYTQDINGLDEIAEKFKVILPADHEEMSNIEAVLVAALHGLVTSSSLNVCDKENCEYPQFQTDNQAEIDLINAVLEKIAPRERGNVEAT